MARNFSDIFRSDENEQDTNVDVSSDSNADNDTGISNDGIMLQTESYSRDEDGNESYDSTTLDTGNLDVVNSLDLDNTINSLLDSSSRSESTDVLDN